MKASYTTTLRRTIALVLLCVVAAQAQAINITTTQSRYEQGGVRYYFTVTDWTTTTSGVNPCRDSDPLLNTCNIMLSATKVSWGPGYQVGHYAIWSVPIRRELSTLGDLYSDLQAVGFRVPLSGSILVANQDASNNLCISFAYATTSGNLGAAFNLFGPCTRVVAPTLQCDITGDTNINHKTLSDIEANGAKASTKLQLKCRGPASVTVSASRTDTNGVQLRDDKSLYSKITINGKDATAGINVTVPNGQAPLNIESTLATRGTVAPGAFSGSTVITVTPP